MHPAQPISLERADRGVALIMVVLVIAALVIIGTPFVLSMRTHEVSSRHMKAEVEARLLAEAAANRAIKMCMDNHEFVERGLGGDDPQQQDFDLFSEFQMVLQDLDAQGQRTVIRWRDSRQSLLEARIYDEQGKLNLNSVPGFTLGNLLGVTELEEDLDLDGKVMKVRPVAAFDTFPRAELEFFSDGDPTTLDGYVRVDTELIGYRHFDGRKFTGLMRGFLFSAPTEESQFHAAGTIVQDGRGQKIALHKMWSQLGDWTPFETVNSVRQIADWTLLRYVEEKLLTWGVSLEDLEEYGLDPANDLAAIKINASRLERPDLEKTEEQKEAEKALEKAGFDPDLIGRMGGSDRVQRMAEMVERIPEEVRDRVLDRYKERQAEMEAYLDDLKKYHGDYMPQAVQDILEFLTQAADIEAIPPSELEKIRDFITTSSTRSRDWTNPLYNENRVQYQADLRNNFNTSIVRLPLTDAMGVGSLLRVVEGDGDLSYRIGVDPEELLTRQFSRYIRRGRGRVALWPQLTGSHEPGTLRVESQIPHPVNLNTADRRVIRAILAGLRGRPTMFPPVEGAAEDLVTLAEAEALTELILVTPLKSHDDLRQLLDAAVEDEIISEQDRNVCLKNAINPGDPTLDLSSVPFCYRSYDVYTVEAIAMVNSEAGTELARYGLRQIVEAAPPEALEWTVDSQRDFTTEVRTVEPAGDPNEDTGGAFLRAERFNPDGNRVARRLERQSNKMTTFPDPIYNTSWIFGDPSHIDTVGEMRLETGVSDDSGASGSLQFSVNVSGGGQGGRLRMGGSGFGGAGRYYEQHFWQTTDGYRIEDRGIQNVPAFGDGERGLPKDDILSGRVEFSDYLTEVAGPGYVSMWIRADAAAGDFTLFDVQDKPDLNRLQLKTEGGEIVFRIADAARDATEGSAMGLPDGRRYAEVRAPIPLRSDVWYHLAASWKGTKPGEQSIFLDGRSVGRPTYTTRLTAGLSEFALPSGTDPYVYEDVFVEDNRLQAGFPEEGTLLIGDEAMEYFRKVGGGFRVRVRRYLDNQTGQRINRRSLPGSTPQDHEDGEVVTVFGYTNFAGTLFPAPATYDMPRGATQAGVVGTLAHRFRNPTPTFTIEEFNAQGAAKAQILLSTTGQSSDPRDLPDRGYITVEQRGIGTGGGPGAGMLQATQSAPVRELMFFRRAGGTSNVLECWRNAEAGHPAPPYTFSDDDRVILSSVEINGPDVTTYFPTDVHEGYIQLWVVDKTQLAQQNPQSVDDFPLPPCEWLYVERPGGGYDATYLADIQQKTGIDTSRIFIVPAGGRRSPLSTSTGAVVAFERQQGGWNLSWMGPRGVGRTGIYDHPPIMTTVQPVYQVQRNDVGQRDLVTVFDNQTPSAQKVERQVVHAFRYWEHYADRQSTEKGYSTGNVWSYCSLGMTSWDWNSPAPDPLPRDLLGVAGARIVKWPADELPTTRPNHFVSFCEEATGGDLMLGLVDEILVRSADSRVRPEERVALSRRVDSAETEIFLRSPVSTNPSLPTPNPVNIVGVLRDGGAIKIEDEVIGVRQASQSGGGEIQLDGCVRGLLGTEPAMHASGISATIQSFPGVTAFDRLEEDRMVVKSTDAFPREGYAAFDRGPAVDLDIWAYKQVRGRNRFTLCRDVRGQPTFLGGMFGTRPTRPNAGDLVVAMPFRYFDRYAPLADSTDAAYFETSRRIPGAIWRSLRWDGTTPAGTEIRILARIDGKPDWSAPPNEPVDGYTLYLFNDPNAPNRIDRMGDQVEVRVHFTYKDGAFKRDLGRQSDEWKDTAVLRSFTLTYHRPLRVLHREELALR